MSIAHRLYAFGVKVNQIHIDHSVYRRQGVACGLTSTEEEKTTV